MQTTREQLFPRHIVARVAVDLLLLLSAFVLPLPYVIGMGAVIIVGFGYYEGVLAGLLFDSVHLALFERASLGEFPVTALFLIFLSIGLIARRVLFYVHPR